MGPGRNLTVLSTPAFATLSCGRCRQASDIMHKTRKKPKAEDAIFVYPFLNKNAFEQKSAKMQKCRKKKKKQTQKKPPIKPFFSSYRLQQMQKHLLLPLPCQLLV